MKDEYLIEPQFQAWYTKQPLILMLTLLTFVFCFYCTISMNRPKKHLSPLFRTILLEIIFLDVLPAFLLKSHLGKD